MKGTASLTAASRYVWRGQSLSKGVVLQPSVTVTYGGFSANLWSNVDLDTHEEDDDGLVMNETDLTLAYAGSVGPVALSGGLIHYDFDGADTEEVFLTAALPVFLNPTLSLYYDFDEGDGGFASLAVSQAFPVTEKIALTAGASVNVNLDNAAMGLDADGNSFTGLYHGEVSLATSIPLFGKVTLDPRIAYAFALSDDAKTAIKRVGSGFDHEDHSVFYASVAATIAF
jgi:hypothetical protein